MDFLRFFWCDPLKITIKFYPEANKVKDNNNIKVTMNAAAALWYDTIIIIVLLTSYAY